MDFPIAMLAVVGVGGAVIGFALHSARKRRDELAAVASELHMEFFPKAEGIRIPEFSEFRLMSQGSSRRARNLMRGNAQGVSVDIFDYSYDTGGGEDNSTTSTSVVRFRSPDLNLTGFELRPEGFFSKLGAALGMQDIDFADSPRFSEMYVLKGKNEPAIRQLFDPELRRSLEKLEGISVEGRGDQLLVYRHGKTSKPNEVRLMFENALRIYTRFSDAAKRSGFAT